MLGVDGIGLNVTLHTMRVNFRMQVRGCTRLGDVGRPCTMASASQRAPDGEQHGKKHQQQDTNSSHKTQVSTGPRAFRGPSTAGAHGKSSG